MFFLSFLPDGLLVAFVNIILFFGIIGTVLGFVSSKIPLISTYGTIIKIVGVVLLIAGVYFKGSLETELKWRQRVAEVEAKLKIAEEKSKIVNTEIVTKYRDRVKVVTDTQIVIDEKIKEVEKIINAKCEVPSEAVDILNQAAENKVKK